MNQASSTSDTIVAIATAAGTGGVGIVRLSGPGARQVAAEICARKLQPRVAHHVRFFDAEGNAIDDGIALSFPAPRSFTGEDVVELQAHGSPVLLRQLVARALTLGARHARAGEFSERAFLNGKFDLAQAEGLADLIAATDARAARAARRALDGAFSRRVEAIAATLLRLRVHVEAAIDFVDEPIDTLGGAQLHDGIGQALEQLDALLADAEHGRKLRDGLHAVIVGPPNAGKSSLLNALAGRDRAIVTEVAGTTRDTLHEAIHVDGLELTLVDTAGLREDGDAIEREGMRRAHAELQRADLALVVVDARNPGEAQDRIDAAIAGVPLQLRIFNKSDLLEGPVVGDRPGMLVSARSGAGLDALRQRLGALAFGEQGSGGDGEFTARGRHVDALARTRARLQRAKRELDHERLELVAEELRLAHDALGEITGTVSPDDLLGQVFATFCIGK